jgi:phosphoserine phosphatase
MSSVDSLGHSISELDLVLIIDLDETLISINSFPLWAKYFLLGDFSNLNFYKRNILRIKAAKIFAERKILGRNHAQTKAALHKLWLKTGDVSALEIFLQKLEKTIRPNMRSVLELIAKNKINAVLATAATSLYAEPFANKIGFSHVISTGISEQENRSEEKSRRAQEFLKKQSWEDKKKIFFTDHLEDMPFMLNSDKLMWFGKPDEVSVIKKSIPNLKIIACQNLTSEEILKEVNS